MTLLFSLSLGDIVIGGGEFLVELSMGLKRGSGGRRGRASVGALRERGGQRPKTANNTQAITEASRTL